jgi:hypothetical protein
MGITAIIKTFRKLISIAIILHLAFLLVACDISGYNPDYKSCKHDWGDWVVITVHTETTDGLEERICKNDSAHIETRIIPATKYGEAFPHWAAYRGNTDNFELSAGYTELALQASGSVRAFHEGWVFVSEGWDIFRMKPDGSQKLKVLVGAADNFRNSVYYDGWLYFLLRYWDGATSYGSELYRMRLDGSEKQRLSSFQNIWGFQGSGDRIYFGSGTDMYIIRKDGTGQRKIIEGFDSSSSFVISGGYIFVGRSVWNGEEQYRTSYIFRYNMDGTNETFIRCVDSRDQLQSHMYPLFVFENNLYYRMSNSINKIRVDGENNQILTNHASNVSVGYNFNGGPDIALKDGFLYYNLDKVCDCENENRSQSIVPLSPVIIMCTSIYRVRIDGTEQTLLYHNASMIDIFGRHIYFRAAPGFVRAKLNDWKKETVLDVTDFEYWPYIYMRGYFVSGNKFYIALHRL